MAKNFKELQARMSPQARSRSEAKAEQMVRDMALDEAFGWWKGRTKSSLTMVRALRRGKRLKNLSG